MKKTTSLKKASKVRSTMLLAAAALLAASVVGPLISRAEAKVIVLRPRPVRPVLVVRVVPAKPKPPKRVWVPGHWRIDRFGHRVWVPGHWRVV